MNTTQICDIAIVGGGLVGATLAFALRNSPWRIVLVEARSADATSASHASTRSIALAYGSRLLLERIGLWSLIQPKVAPIRNIHISSRGQFGFTQLNFREQGVEALGYVVTNHALENIHYQQLRQINNLKLLMPARLQAVKTLPEYNMLTLKQGNKELLLNARLLVVADGAASKTRCLLGIDAKQKSYQQHALIANITSAASHDNVAYERFTEYGPIALLPLPCGRHSLVWVQPEKATENLLNISEDRFLSHLQTAFGWRLGRFEQVSQRSAYPLSHCRAEKDIAARAVLIGNASHSLHPVAGQGLNLGLRDVAALAQMLHQENLHDPGLHANLQRYAAARKNDYQAVLRMTDGLLRIFVQPFPHHIRSAGLVAANLCPIAKRTIARLGMGLH